MLFIGNSDETTTRHLRSPDYRSTCSLRDLVSFSHDQPFFAKDVAAGGGEPGTNILTLYTNLYLWWVASDVPVGHVVSNQWLDRIRDRLMGQGNATISQPTLPTESILMVLII